MIQLPMVFQVYTPQIHLGDWQLIVFVNRRRNRIILERCHSSDQPCHPRQATDDGLLRIDTGIRAFRRQMPVVASALEKIDTAAMSDAEIIEAVFSTLASLYAPSPLPDDNLFADSRMVLNFSEFLEDRKLDALAALNAVKH